jgi:16S rRNA processing protein RimM
VLVPIGRFGRAHGVRGEIRFWPFNLESELLRGKKSIRIGHRKTRVESYRVAKLRFDAKGCVLKLDEFGDRESVGCLTSQFWFEPRDVFPELAENEVYFTDLIGLVVVTAQGLEIGHVKDVLDLGPNEILVIDRGGTEAMLPNVDEFVQCMDLDKGEIIVTPPEGLIDGV